MALNFPSSPTVGPPATTYGRWVWNGAAWVPIPTVAVPTLPIAGGVITGNLGVQGTTTISGTLTAAGHTALNTLGVNGQATFDDGVEIDGVDAADFATKTYVDEAVASGGLWQGTWDASANNPDLTNTGLQRNGWGWTIVTPDPTAPFDIPATPAIPGVSGVTVYNGDHVIWSATAGAFEIVHGSSLSLQEAQGMFLSLDNGGTVDGNTNFSADVNITSSGTLTVNGVNVALQTPIAAPTVLSQPGAPLYSVKPFTVSLDFDDPSVAFYQLQSTDMVQMFYYLVFNLTNLAPGKRKQVIVQTSQLYRAIMYSGPGGTSNSEGINGYWHTVGITEGGISVYDWHGRDNVAMAANWFRRSGDIGGMTEGMRSWRTKVASQFSGNPTTPQQVRASVVHTGVFNDSIGRWWKDYFTATHGLAWNYTIGTVRPMSYLKATFDYYSPTMKFMTCETYFPRTRIGT